MMIFIFEVCQSNGRLKLKNANPKRRRKKLSVNYIYYGFFRTLQIIKITSYVGYSCLLTGYKNNGLL